ncbi:hypothetical protein ABZ446_30120 [Streptomyces sp. NPDC005813]|uniref:hypothetical protein n=1 Tax=Streptomyces sp. NPDC005813 TaxID=3155592 RepID=UPI0033ED0DA2
MTSDMVRPRWRPALRGFLLFLAAGGLSSFVYEKMRHHSVDGSVWGGLLFGAIVCATLTALFPGRRRR